MVNANDYIARVVSAIQQSKLARRTLHEFGESPIALARLIAEEATGLRELFQKAGDPAAPDEVIKRRNQLLDRYSENRQASLPSQLASVGNRLSQNELILLVALFEDQMKQIHREVLIQDPTCLNPERTVPLGKLFSDGIDAVLADEIEREVQSLDRKSVSERAKYFRERLQIDWVGGTAVPFVERVISLRNDILHSSIDRVVSNSQVEEARFVALTVPMHCCLCAAERFPLAFPGWITSRKESQHGA